MSSNADGDEAQRSAQSGEEEANHSSGKPTHGPSKEALEGPQSPAPTKKFEYQRAPGGMYTCTQYRWSGYQANTCQTSQPRVAPVKRSLLVITKTKAMMTRKINPPAIMNMDMVGLSSISETSCMYKDARVVVLWWRLYIKSKEWKFCIYNVRFIGQELDPISTVTLGLFCRKLRAAPVLLYLTKLHLPYSPRSSTHVMNCPASKNGAYNDACRRETKRLGFDLLRAGCSILDVVNTYSERGVGLTR